ncbi:OadG family protein [Maribacter arcticus]|uniref:OadG family protein n=1 Tax=Maribacter arcticus TaxID=561365 RepID=UPI003002B6A2
MIKDIFLSFKENIKQKTTNPFFGTLTIVWIVHNWELIYTFFNFESTSNLTNRIDYLSVHFSSIPFIKNLFVCIGITFVVLILSYIFLSFSRFIINIFEKIITPLIYKITDKSSIVLKEDYQLLQTERNQLFTKLEEERAAKLKSQGEVTKLEEKISELLASEEITIDNLIDSKNEHSNDNSKLLSTILKDENKKKILDELIDSSNNDDWFEITKENTDNVNYFLRANIIQISEKHVNGDVFRKYIFTDYGNILKKEYINKTLH